MFCVAGRTSVMVVAATFCETTPGSRGGFFCKMKAPRSQTPFGNAIAGETLFRAEVRPRVGQVRGVAERASLPRAKHSVAPKRIPKRSLGTRTRPLVRWIGSIHLLGRNPARLQEIVSGFFRGAHPARPESPPPRYPVRIASSSHARA